MDDEEYEYVEEVTVSSGGGLSGLQIAGMVLGGAGLAAIGYAIGNHAGKKSERKRLASGRSNFELRPGSERR